VEILGRSQPALEPAAQLDDAEPDDADDVGADDVGAEEARAETLGAEIPASDDRVDEVAAEVVQQLLDLLEVDADVEMQPYQTTDGDEQISAPLAFDIEGEDLGILIGRRGQTLACFQYLVRLIVSHQTKVWTPIVIDIEGYKQRRSEALQGLAVRMAAQVKSRGTPFTLEPMPAYERRIIHLALADHPDVATESVGQGDFRKVVIYPDSDQPR
jgi:spoIIIJ-associated protein